MPPLPTGSLYVPKERVAIIHLAYIAKWCMTKFAFL